MVIPPVAREGPGVWGFMLSHLPVLRSMIPVSQQQLVPFISPEDIKMGQYKSPVVRDEGFYEHEGFVDYFSKKDLGTYIIVKRKEESDVRESYRFLVRTEAKEPFCLDFYVTPQGYQKEGSEQIFDSFSTFKGHVISQASIDELHGLTLNLLEKNRQMVLEHKNFKKCTFYEDPSKELTTKMPGEYLLYQYENQREISSENIFFIAYVDENYAIRLKDFRITDTGFLDKSSGKSMPLEKLISESVPQNFDYEEIDKNIQLVESRREFMAPDDKVTAEELKNKLEQYIIRPGPRKGVFTVSFFDEWKYEVRHKMFVVTETGFNQVNFDSDRGVSDPISEKSVSLEECITQIILFRTPEELRRIEEETQKKGEAVYENDWWALKIASYTIGDKVGKAHRPLDKGGNLYSSGAALYETLKTMPGIHSDLIDKILRVKHWHSQGKVAMESREVLEGVIDSIYREACEELKQKRSVLLPGGWPSHAMLYELEVNPEEEGTFVFRIYNSGKGIHFHQGAGRNKKVLHKEYIISEDKKEELIKKTP